MHLGRWLHSKCRRVSTPSTQIQKFAKSRDRFLPKKLSTLMISQDHETMSPDLVRFRTHWEKHITENAQYLFENLRLQFTQPAKKHLGLKIVKWAFKSCKIPILSTCAIERRKWTFTPNYTSALVSTAQRLPNTQLKTLETNSVRNSFGLCKILIF